MILIAFTCIVYADQAIPQTPEVQGLTTSTTTQTQGTVTEADSLAWTTTAYEQFTSVDTSHSGGDLPQGPPIGPPLNPVQLQDTTGYNAMYSGVSGQTTFAKSMALSTANQIADGSNVNAKTNVQFIAIDTGRATNSEDLLLDTVSNASETEFAILCPFAASTSEIIPPYCNIVQAGSSFDSTLTSTITSANDKFTAAPPATWLGGSDSSGPDTLNYNVASKGITLSDGTSSPMIGSAAAYLKVHVQEARNISYPDDESLYWNNVKSEDLAYSETATASGLISGFSKSMSYQSGFNLI